MFSKQRVLCTIFGSACLLQAQQQQRAPAFEVATIRPNNGGGGAFLQALPGRLTMTNMSVKTLIVVGYGIQGFQIAGDPPWIGSSNYDVQAVAAGNTPVNEIEGPMLRKLLEERFKLATHRETRQLPAYELTLVKDASKLQPAKPGSCIPYAADAPPLAASALGGGIPFCGYPHSASNGLNRALDGAGVSMGCWRRICRGPNSIEL